MTLVIFVQGVAALKTPLSAPAILGWSLVRVVKLRWFWRLGPHLHFWTKAPEKLTSHSNSSLFSTCYLQSPD